MSQSGEINFINSSYTIKNCAHFWNAYFIIFVIISFLLLISRPSLSKFFYWWLTVFFCVDETTLCVRKRAPDVCSLFIRLPVDVCRRRFLFLWFVLFASPFAVFGSSAFCFLCCFCFLFVCRRTCRRLFLTKLVCHTHTDAHKCSWVQHSTMTATYCQLARTLGPSALCTTSILTLNLKNTHAYKQRRERERERATYWTNVDRAFVCVCYSLCITLYGHLFVLCVAHCSLLDAYVIWRTPGPRHHLLLTLFRLPTTVPPS